MTRSLTSEPWSRILDPRYAPDHAFLLNASTEVLHADLYAAPIGLYEPSQQPHCSKTRKALCGSVQVEQGHRADAERIRAGIEQCWHPASCGIGTISPTSRFVRKCAPPPPSGAVMVMFLIQADSPCLARSGVCVCVCVAPVRTRARTTPSRPTWRHSRCHGRSAGKPLDRVIRPGPYGQPFPRSHTWQNNFA
jgi:hypothetical protein